jgi:threonine/homoserine/homoserine lactone efflux protein
MLGIHDLGLFLAAGLLLNVTPGPDIAYIVGRSTQYGVRGGVAAALGICAGCFVHISVAAVGLSAALVASASAFTMLKWVGATYLVYVGIRMLTASQPDNPLISTTNLAPTARLRMIFLQGLLTNVLNPKVALFFLAFLPQFIPAGASSKVTAFVILGLIFNLTGTLWNLGVAWCAGRLASAHSALHLVRIWVDRLLGVMFVGLGVRLALSEKP